MPSSKLIDVNVVYQNDPKLKREDVKNLQNWIRKQPHLPETAELDVMLFIKSCYYSNEAAKIAVDNYFTVRTLCPDLFRNRNPKDAVMQKTMNVSLMNFLPKHTDEGYCINYIRLMDADPDNFNLPNQIKLVDMLTSLHLHTDGPCNGYVVVFDMEGLVFGHLTKVSVVVLKKFLFYVQEAVPIRLKAIHVINVVSWVDKLLALVKPFLKKELIDMLVFHNDIESLFKFVPKDCMPSEFGGKCESLAALHEKSKQLVNDNAEFFLKEDTQLVDETKRPGKAKNAGDLFGIEGTFKKLQVD